MAKAREERSEVEKKHAELSGTVELPSSDKTRRPPRPRARFADEHRLMLSLLIEARHAAGLSQRALADKLGKAQSHVAAIEVNGRDLSSVELYRWCRAVGLPFSEFARQFEAIMDTTFNESDISQAGR